MGRSTAVGTGRGLQGEAPSLGRIKPAALGLACIGAALQSLGVPGTRPVVLAAMVVFGTGFAFVFPAVPALGASSGGLTRVETRGTTVRVFTFLAWFRVRQSCPMISGPQKPSIVPPHEPSS